MPLQDPYASAAPRLQQPALVRMQNERVETPRPILRMPSPEELGLRLPPATNREVDWNHVRQRVHALNLTSFHMQKLPEGGFRFVCFVPTNAGERRVQAEAVYEAEAIHQALSQAESLR